ncbi:MAG TPA: LamB/YcsF family protein, partial [Thermodesulfobacteriota bacterium]
MKVDISADVGESFGRWKLGYDEELMQHISSANLACGFHAGDPMVMRHTVKLCKKHRVKIGT